MSSEEDDDCEIVATSQGHKFAQPEEFNFDLESGAIPDAAMIHAARKKRQKAREQGENSISLMQFLQISHVSCNSFR